MTTAAKFLLAAPIAFAVSIASGCDSDAPSPTDYRTVAHVDLDAAGSAPWVKKAFGTGAIDVGKELGACGDLLEAAQSVTVGAGDSKFEVYVTGKLDADVANDCADHLEKHATKSGKTKGGDEPEALMLDDDLFVVFRGATPSRASYESLLASDPSPGGAKPMWVVAQPDAKTTKAPVAYVQAWADTAKGFDAHVEVQLKDEATATELYGKAMLGLTAVQLSGEADELTKGIKLDNQGDTLAADLHVSPKDMNVLIDKGKAKAAARIDGHEKHKEHFKHHGKGEHSFSISFGDEE